MKESVPKQVVIGYVIATTPPTAYVACALDTKRYAHFAQGVPREKT